MNQILQRQIIVFGMVLSFANFTYGVAGGYSANQEEFPHGVQLSSYQNGEFLCGGSIIHPSVILTAAHCLRKNSNAIDASAILVTAGSLKLKNVRHMIALFAEKENEVQFRRVDRYIIHPDYKKDLLENDLALVFLTYSLEVTETVRTIQLPSNSRQTYSSGIFAGWGRTNVIPWPSTSLRKLNVNLASRDRCNWSLQGTSRVTGNNVCSVFNSYRGPRQFDDGSSLVCHESHSDFASKTSTPVLCGIYSWGRVDSANYEMVTVFVEVSKYLDWIQNKAELQLVEVRETLDEQTPEPDHMSEVGSGNGTTSDSEDSLERNTTDQDKTNVQIEQEMIDLDSDQMTSNISEEVQNNLQENCTRFEGYFNCRISGTLKCIPNEKVCDGMEDCGNGMDENKAICKSVKNDSPPVLGNISEAVSEENPTVEIWGSTVEETSTEKDEKEARSKSANDLENETKVLYEFTNWVCLLFLAILGAGFIFAVIFRLQRRIIKPFEFFI